MSSNRNDRRGLGANLAALRHAKGMTLAQLQAASGVDISTINALERRNSQRSAVAGRLAWALGVTLDYLMSDNIDPLTIEIGGTVPDPPQDYHHSPVIRWEVLMRGCIAPKQFKVALPDNAMAPKVPAGTVCKFEAIEPEFGDVVLVRDNTGALHCRAYRQRSGGPGFAAVPFNDAYAALDSEAHGLTVLAVLTGLDVRYSRI